MPTPVDSRNGPCYLDGGTRVAEQVVVRSWPMSDPPLNVSPSDNRPTPSAGAPEPLETRWITWGRSLLAVAVVSVLVALGIANITTRARWHEVEDGVLWAARAEGV